MVEILGESYMATLEELRIEAELSLGALSRKAGVDIKTVRRALDGERVQQMKAVAIVRALSETLQRPLKLEDIDGLRYT
jgi:predicted transcriptional regulator